MKVTGPIGTLPGHFQAVHRDVSLRFPCPRTDFPASAPISTNQSDDAYNKYLAKREFTPSFRADRGHKIR